MRKSLLLLFLILGIHVYAQNSNKSFKISGEVTDICISGDSLIIADNQGYINIYNHKKQKHLRTLHIPDIRDFTGNKVNARIHSFDFDKQNDALIICSQGSAGYSNLYLYFNKKTYKILDAKENKMNIKSVFFLDPNTAIIASLSSELFAIDIFTGKILWKTNAGQSRFSAMQLDKQNKTLAMGGESGKVFIFDLLQPTNSPQIIDLHLDNIYDIDYKNDHLISGGKDKKVCTYTGKVSNSKSTDFIVYQVAVSDDGQQIAFSSGEGEAIEIMNWSADTIIQKIESRDAGIRVLQIINNAYLVAGYEDGWVFITKLN